MKRAYLLLVLSLTSKAADVYVNGVNVDGLTNQRFEKVTVFLDDKGHVHIDAPGYTVKHVEEPDTRASVEYVLALDRSGNALGYDIGILLDGKLLKTLKAEDEQLVLALPKSLKVGKHILRLTTKKAPGDRPMVSSIAVEMVLGEGKIEKAQVNIANPILQVNRLSSDGVSGQNEFEFEIKK
jgi:hypothetical protein